MIWKNLKVLNKYLSLFLRGYFYYIAYRLWRFVRGFILGKAKNHDFFFFDNEGEYSKFINTDSDLEIYKNFASDKKWGYRQRNQWLTDQLKSKGLFHLHETYRLLALQPPPIRKKKRAVILHLFYPQLLHEIVSYASSLEFDYYITIPDWLSSSHVKEIQNLLPEAYIIAVANRGRDFLPFLLCLPTVLDLNYEWVCKIHSKRSYRGIDGDLWRRDTMSSLFHPNTIGLLNGEPKLGLLSPYASHLPIDIFIFDNKKKLNELYEKLEIEIPSKQFTAGSMFWFRPQALENIMQATHQIQFDEESGQDDGTMAHALERVIHSVVEKNGYYCREANYL